MNVDLKGKVIVITGSSRGIGASLIQSLAKEQAKVVLNYNKSEDEAKKLAAKIREYNKECILIKADTTKEEEVKNLYKTAIKAYGKVDILINNAGISKNNILFRMSIKQWDDVINCNMKSTFLCSKYFAKGMMKQNYGKIINIASLLGQIGCAGQVNYSASKAGIIATTKSLAKELGTWDISVNALCPGYVTTDLESSNALFKQNSNQNTISEVKDYLNEHDYLNVLINFVIYMCSDYFHSITGQVFNLDSRH